jgi:hypothetical protein
VAVERTEANLADPGNPVMSVRHLTRHKSDECLGLLVWVWCPGCQALHTPRFRCFDHGGPFEGPIWEGDPYSSPFTMSPSLLVRKTDISPRCHSFIENDHWRFLGDSSHSLANHTVPLEPLPNWLAKDV